MSKFTCWDFELWWKFQTENKSNKKRFPNLCKDITSIYKSWWLKRSRERSAFLLGVMSFGESPTLVGWGGRAPIYRAWLRPSLRLGLRKLWDWRVWMLAGVAYSCVMSRAWPLLCRPLSYTSLRTCIHKWHDRSRQSIQAQKWHNTINKYNT